MRQRRSVFIGPSGRYSLLFWVLSFSCITTAAAAQSSSPIEGERIRVDVNVATLKFMVKETDGGLINHLNQDHFRVFEGGVLQEIVFFEPPRNREGEMGPLRLAFLIDMSGSTLATRAEELTAAGTFLDSVDDFTEVGIFGFTDELMPLQDFTSTRSRPDGPLQFPKRAHLADEGPSRTSPESGHSHLRRHGRRLSNRAPKHLFGPEQ
jgi:hypothetical protein